MLCCYLVHSQHCATATSRLGVFLIYFIWIQSRLLVENLNILFKALILGSRFAQIFAESLLCSSRLENIHLAGQMMQCHAGSDSLPAGAAQKGRAPYRVQYERSTDLVLAASREYFNSSTSLTDSCMDLARWGAPCSSRGGGWPPEGRDSVIGFIL